MAPPPGRERTAIAPPCSSMTRRATYRPSPEPTLRRRTRRARTARRAASRRSRSRGPLRRAPPCRRARGREPRSATPGRAGGRCRAGRARPAPCGHRRRRPRCHGGPSTARPSRTPRGRDDWSERVIEVERARRGGAPLEQQPHAAHLVRQRCASVRRPAGRSRAPVPAQSFGRCLDANECGTQLVLALLLEVGCLPAVRHCDVHDPQRLLFWVGVSMPV